MNVFNTTCEVRQQDPTEEDLCPSQLVIPIFNAAQVSALDEQNVTIRRILGHLYFRPTLAATEPDVEGMTCYMRLGLKRFQIPSGAQDPLAFLWNPLRGTDITELGTDDEIGDFTDSNMMRQWELFWAAQTTIENFLMPATPVWKPRLEDCAGILGEYCVDPDPLTDGNGTTYSSGPGGVGHLPMKLGGVQSCESCGDGLGSSRGAITWQWKHIPIDMKFKRGLTLKGEDYLALFGGFENLAVPAGDRPPQPTMYYFGGLRALVER